MVFFLLDGIVICTGEKSCQSSSIMFVNNSIDMNNDTINNDKSIVYCNGYQSCDNSLITNVQILYMLGKQSGTNSIITTKQNATNTNLYFYGFESGLNMTIYCSPYSICNIYSHYKATNINLNTILICQGSCIVKCESDTSDVSSCFNVTIDADTYPSASLVYITNSPTSAPVNIPSLTPTAQPVTSIAESGSLQCYIDSSSFNNNNNNNNNCDIDDDELQKCCDYENDIISNDVDGIIRDIFGLTIASFSCILLVLVMGICGFLMAVIDSDSSCGTIFLTILKIVLSVATLIVDIVTIAFVNDNQLPSLFSGMVSNDCLTINDENDVSDLASYLQNILIFSVIEMILGIITLVCDLFIIFVSVGYKGADVKVLGTNCISIVINIILSGINVYMFVGALGLVLYFLWDFS